MIKASKKVIAMITSVTTTIIVGSTILANLAIKTTNKEDNNDKTNRGESYHYYPIYNKIANNRLLNNLIDYSANNNQITYFINENKFLSNLKIMVMDALKNIPMFAKEYSIFDVVCKYKIISSHKIIIDLVWNKPNNKYKFYDQFAINLLTT